MRYGLRIRLSENEPNKMEVKCVRLGVDTLLTNPVENCLGRQLSWGRSSNLSPNSVMVCYCKSTDLD